jgi:hypothetical protein
MDYLLQQELLAYTKRLKMKTGMYWYATLGYRTNCDPRWKYNDIWPKHTLSVKLWWCDNDKHMFPSDVINLSHHKIPSAKTHLLPVYKIFRTSNLYWDITENYGHKCDHNRNNIPQHSDMCSRCKKAYYLSRISKLKKKIEMLNCD